MDATAALNKERGSGKIALASSCFFWDQFAPLGATHISFGMGPKGKIIWYDDVKKISCWDDLREWESYSGAVCKKSISDPRNKKPL